MEFRAERDALAEAVTWTARALPQRPPVPVLSGLLLEADADGLHLSCFDYEVSARTTVEADVAVPGSALVSGRLLAEIVRSLPRSAGGEDQAAAGVEVVSDGSKLTLSCRSSRFSLMTMPVEEYPSRPALPEAAGSVAGDALADAVARVALAASRDETLPILTGVRLEIEGGRLTLLATDRYRLALREIAWGPTSPDASTALLVRARTLSELSRSLGPADVTLGLSADDGPAGIGGRRGAGMIGLSAGARSATSQLLDGDYPRVRALFPAQALVTAVVGTAALVETVKRVALVAERNTPVRLTFSGDQVRVEAGQGEDAQASEQVRAVVTGGEITTGFNPQFLLDGLGAVDAPFVRLSFTEPGKPAVLTGQAEPDAEHDMTYRYLLMPVRLAA